MGPRGGTNIMLSVSLVFKSNILSHSVQYFVHSNWILSKIPSNTNITTNEYNAKDQSVHSKDNAMPDHRKMYCWSQKPIFIQIYSVKTGIFHFFHFWLVGPFVIFSKSYQNTLIILTGIGGTNKTEVESVQLGKL